MDTFLKRYPDTAVVLNIDADHLDYFGTVENIIKSFHKFCEMATKSVVYNLDDANTCKAVEGITGKGMITFGTKAGAVAGWWAFPLYDSRKDSRYDRFAGLSDGAALLHLSSGRIYCRWINQQITCSRSFYRKWS